MDHSAETERTRDAVTKFYQDYRDRDFDALANALAEDVDWAIEFSSDYFPFAGARRGREATVAALRDIVATIEHLRYDEVFTLADGARACAKNSRSQRLTTRKQHGSAAGTIVRRPS